MQHYSMAVYLLQKGISEHIITFDDVEKGDNFKLRLLAKYQSTQNQHP